MHSDYPIPASAIAAAARALKREDADADPMELRALAEAALRAAFDDLGVEVQKPKVQRVVARKLVEEEVGGHHRLVSRWMPVEKP